MGEFINRLYLCWIFTAPNTVKRLNDGLTKSKLPFTYLPCSTSTYVPTQPIPDYDKPIVTKTYPISLKNSEEQVRIDIKEP